MPHLNPCPVRGPNCRGSMQAGRSKCSACDRSLKSNISVLTTSAINKKQESAQTRLFVLQQREKTYKGIKRVQAKLVKILEKEPAVQREQASTNEMLRNLSGEDWNDFVAVETVLTSFEAANTVVLVPAPSSAAPPALVTQTPSSSAVEVAAHLASGAAPMSVDSGAQSLCIICDDNPREVVFLPCKHFVTCRNCADALWAARKDDCPVCRTHVDQGRDRLPNEEVFET